MSLSVCGSQQYSIGTNSANDSVRTGSVVVPVVWCHMEIQALLNPSAFVLNSS